MRKYGGIKEETEKRPCPYEKSGRHKTEAEERIERIEIRERLRSA